MDKGRNLRSQERIGVCSTNVETLFYSFTFSFERNGGKVRGGVHIILNLQVRLGAVEELKTFLSNIFIYLVKRK